MASFSRAIVALNNVAVAMIERHSYVQGIETLRDAVSLVKASLAVDQTSALNEEGRNLYLQAQQEVARMQDEYLQKAAERYADPHRSSSCVLVQVCSDDIEGNPGCDPFMQNLLSQYSPRVTQEARPPSAFVAYPVRIEPKTQYLDQIPVGEVPDGMARLYATVLYNCGVSYVCMARAIVNPDLAEKKRKYGSKAVSLLNLASDMVGVCSDALEEARNDEEYYRRVQSELSLMSMAILYSLIFALRDSNQIARAMACKLRLEEIVSVFASEFRWSEQLRQWA